MEKGGLYSRCCTKCASYFKGGNKPLHTPFKKKKKPNNLQIATALNVASDKAPLQGQLAFLGGCCLSRHQPAELTVKWSRYG